MLTEAIQLADMLAAKENQNYYVIRLHCGRLDLINETNFKRQGRTAYKYKTDLQRN